MQPSDDAEARGVWGQHVYGSAETAVWKHAMGPDRWQIPAVIEELKANAPFSLPALDSSFFGVG